MKFGRRTRRSRSTAPGTMDHRDVQTVKGFLQADANEREPRSVRQSLLLRYSANGNGTSPPLLQRVHYKSKPRDSSALLFGVLPANQFRSPTTSGFSKTFYRLSSANDSQQRVEQPAFEFKRLNV